METERKVWGKGYATEGAKANLQYEFEELGFEDIYSFTADINQPSKHVMRKIGMEFVKEFDHPRLVEDSPSRKNILFRIQRS